ncbi:MAG: hypothetical protein ABL895_14670 [Cyclobacteriaceae bacterium]
MKRYMIMILVGLLYVGVTEAVAQKFKNKNKPTCDGNSYSTEIVSKKTISQTCVEYVVKVSYDGTRAFGLSHVTLAIPCGEVKNITNSENWKQVFGKDPTTGVYGLKIDDINGFGEKRADSFTIKFMWCSNSSCEKKLGVVAYKAGQCIDYGKLTYSHNHGSDDKDCDDHNGGGDDDDDHTGGGGNDDDDDDNDDGGDGGGDDNPGDSTNTCSTLAAQLQKVNAPCAAVNNGQLQVIIQDGTEPYTYRWTTGETTSTIQNLMPGNYAVTITDANTNTLTLSEAISAPEAITVAEAVIHPSCTGSTNGSIDVTLTGGSGAYTVTWSNGSTEQDLTNLAGGAYTITVTDTAGCVVQKTITLNNTTSLAAGVSFTHPTCTQINGTIDITPSGGVAPYTYLWSTGATTQDLQNGSAGTYSVKITDAVGCSIDKVYALRIVSPVVLSYVVTPTSCADNGSGAINITVSGGTAPYTYLWQDGVATEDRSALKAALYKVTVTDAVGCTATTNISVFKKAFEVTSQVVEAKCAGDLASITISPVDGVSPYTYSWSTGDTDNSVTDLVAGVYSVTITDASGCSRTMVYVLTTPSAISATSVTSNAQCSTEGAYAIDLTVSGGKSPYTYAWSNGTSTEDLNGLNSGTYAVTIKDANGCTTTHEVVINATTSTWSCLINSPSVQAVCKSVGNILSTPVAGATTYQWTVSSTDNSWSITAGSTTSSVVFTAGNPGSSATFTLAITSAGCTQTCTYKTATKGCVEKDNTGGGDPSTGDPCSADSTSAPTNTPEPAEEKPVEPAEEDAKLNVCAYPNPFVDRIKFEWTAPADDHVQVEIYDGLGRKVCEVFSGQVRKGQSCKADWIPNGQQDKTIYFYKYRSSKKVEQGRLLKR